jgi:hypothetical protein
MCHLPSLYLLTGFSNHFRAAVMVVKFWNVDTCDSKYISVLCDSLQTQDYLMIINMLQVNLMKTTCYKPWYNSVSVSYLKQIRNIIGLGEVESATATSCPSVIPSSKNIGILSFFMSCSFVRAIILARSQYSCTQLILLHAVNILARNYPCVQLFMHIVISIYHPDSKFERL